MRLLIINNMSSGFNDGAIYDYIRMVASDNDDFRIRYTDGTTNIADLLDDVSHYDVVVAAGGDGTIASVSYALAHTGIPILPFPAGTGNLLATNLKSPIEPIALARMTKEMKTIDFDMGELLINESKYGFSIMAGAGYDATIMSHARPRKKKLGPLSYFQAALSNVAPQKSRIILTIDGKRIESEGLGFLIINFSRIQFDIPITPNNNAQDGLFDIAILKAENAFELIPALIAGILDREGYHPDRTDSVEIYQGKHIIAHAYPPFKIQFDGEVPELETPVEAHILESATRYIVCDNAYEEFTRNKKN